MIWRGLLFQVFENRPSEGRGHGWHQAPHAGHGYGWQPSLIRGYGWGVGAARGLNGRGAGRTQ